MTISNEKLTSIKAKIVALSQKTVENGCTEHEAMAALAMVGKLLNDYNLNMDEVELRQEKCISDFIATHGKNVNNNIGSLLSVIAKFTDCKCWIAYGWDQKAESSTRQYTLFGLASDVAMAKYLMKVCTLAMLNGSTAYVKSLGIGQGGARTPSNNWQQGFASRIYMRLQKIKEQNEANNSVANYGNNNGALIVLKGQLVTEEFVKMNLQLKQRQVAASKRDDYARQAGAKAANNVNLSRPISANGEDGKELSKPNALLN